MKKIISIITTVIIMTAVLQPTMSANAAELVQPLGGSVTPAPEAADADASAVLPTTEAVATPTPTATPIKTPAPSKPLKVSENQIPNIPLIRIQTEDGTIPTADALPAPEGYGGVATTNKEYVKGVMSLTGGGVNAGTYTMKFKVRGNTSSAYVEKKSYKLKLDEKADLFGRGDIFANKSWVLLNCGTNLKYWTGNKVSRLVGMEWTPAMTFVNVEINGDWRGLYILTEQVEEGISRVNISDNGYLFEYDAYFWNEDAYFKTNAQFPQFGYTFKYPEVTGNSDSRLLWLKSYMQNVENLMASGSPALWTKIDVDTWTRWMIARDILGQSDSAGSNMYFYKNSRNASDKVKMGPLWDFDTAYDIKNGFSNGHIEPILPFAQLFNNDTYRQSYVSNWNLISPTLLSTLGAQMDALSSSQGAAIDASRRLDQKRWGGTFHSVSSEISTDKKWLSEHIAWMNDAIVKNYVAPVEEKIQASPEPLPLVPDAILQN